MLLNPAHLLSFGFGSGLAPKAPGTFGTLVAIPPYLLMTEASLAVYLGIVIAGFVVGVLVCQYTSRALGIHDHGAIVWDEIVGFWITMIAIPASWLWILLGFMLFRMFDILKPWPVSLADKKMKGGFGIMFDDLLAAVYALACMHLVVSLSS